MTNNGPKPPKDFFQARLIGSRLLRGNEGVLLNLEFEDLDGGEKRFITLPGKHERLFDRFYLSLIPYLACGDVPHFNGRSWMCKSFRDKGVSLEEISKRGVKVLLASRLVERPEDNTVTYYYRLAPKWKWEGLFDCGGEI